MGIIDLLKLSTRMFKARTARTLLTILGMGVGIGAILFLVGLGYGIQRTLLETITTSDSLLTLDVYPGEAADAIPRSDISVVGAVQGVELVSPVGEVAGQIRFDNLVSDTKILAVDRDFMRLDGMKVTEGYGITDAQPDGVVITGALARIFERAPQDMLGGRLTLLLPGVGGAPSREQTVTIVGYTDKKDVTVYINSASLPPEVAGADVSRLKVKCLPGTDLEAVRSLLTGEGYVVSALTDLTRQVDKAFGVVRVILGFFGAIALMVSAIGMFNTMTVALLERTEEIGIMKSIGAANRDIMLMFVTESTLMGFLGGIAGLVLGVIGGKGFNIILNFLAERFGGYAVSLFYYPGWFLMFIVGVATLVGFLTGVVPARKASATDPLEALRYK